MTDPRVQKARFYQREGVVSGYDRLRFGGRSGAWVQDEEERALDELLSQVPRADGALALDVPTGTGRLLGLLRRRYRRVVAVDLSRPMLEEARGRGLAEGYLVGDVLALPLAEGSVDLILCSRLMFHLENVAPALGELARCLAPGGHAVADFYNWSPRRWIPGRQSWLGGRVHMHDRAAVEQAARASGLRIVSIRPTFVLTPFVYRFLPLRVVRAVERLGRGGGVTPTKAYYLLQRPREEPSC